MVPTAGPKNLPFSVVPDGGGQKGEQEWSATRKGRLGQDLRNSCSTFAKGEKRRSGDVGPMWTKRHFDRGRRQGWRLGLRGGEFGKKSAGQSNGREHVLAGAAADYCKACPGEKGKGWKKTMVRPRAGIAVVAGEELLPPFWVII